MLFRRSSSCEPVLARRSCAKTPYFPEGIMRYLALAAIFFSSIPLIAQQAVPEIRFRAQTDFFQLPPDLYFGEAAGVAVNSRGHIFVFSRGNTSGPAYGAAA